MTIYINPFYGRASEQLGDVRGFVQTFGPGAIDMLPEQVWDRLVILRSTRGAGKTSLMRVFTVESLDWMRRNMKPADPVFHALQGRGVVDEDQIHRLGVLVNLDRDYRSLLDLPFPEETIDRLFFRLLDVRVLLAAMRAALAITGRQYPDDIDSLQFGGLSPDPRTEAALHRVGGPSGRGVLDYARDTEHRVLGLLDALLVTASEAPMEGHNELYCIDLLAESMIISGSPLAIHPLIMFDDGHRLASRQREALLEQLRRRNTKVARWYSERFEALSDQELLSDVGESGRDHLLVQLDEIARHGSLGNRSFQRGRHNRVLEDISRRRAAPVLLTYAQERQDFLSLLDEDRDSALGSREGEIVTELRNRVNDLAGREERYREWIEMAEQQKGWEGVVHWREVEVLIHRDLDRQQGLFEDALTNADAENRLTAAIREGAAVSVAEEFRLPYYGGALMVTRLASYNIEQFLSLCGSLFDEMLVDISLGRQPYLQLRRQHRVLRQASEQLWESIPRTVPHGRDVQAIVREIAAIAKEEGVKPTMPYPPGVTGTAMLMGERAQLLDPEYRERTPGASRLFAALASAVAHNVISAELDYSVKGSRYMVLYLNRLLCPRFWLPLGLGSFRERRLSTLIGWMQKLPSHGAVAEPQTEQLPYEWSVE